MHEIDIADKKIGGKSEHFLLKVRKWQEKYSFSKIDIYRQNDTVDRKSAVLTNLTNVT